MPTLPPVRRFVSSSGVRIYRIPCQVLPKLSGRVYLLLGAGPPTLVDAGSGSPECTLQILRGLAAVGEEFGEAFRPAEIDRILLTHAHIDHFGGLPQIVRRTGAEVAVHVLDARTVAAFDERAAASSFAFDRFLREAGLDAPRRSAMLEEFGYFKQRVEDVAVQRLLHDGDRLDGLRIIHTPGHSPGHVCIAVDEILLAGDHVLSRTVSQLWPESVTASTGLAHYLDSLERVAGIDSIELILAGHEPPVRDVPRRLEEIRVTHRRRLDRVMEILASGDRPMTIDQVTERMYSRQRGFPALLALADVGARVEYLEQRGRIALANYQQLAANPCPVRTYRAT